MKRSSKRNVRLERQREYQRQYRRRLRSVRRPDRDAIAQSFLYLVITRALREPEGIELLKKLTREVSRLLVELGYDPEETRLPSMRSSGATRMAGLSRESAWAIRQS